MTACQAFFIYFSAVSVAAAAVTIYDKLAAKLHKRRIPEHTLLLIGALGGAAAMFATMLCIRHKTRHIKFMAGLPALTALHLAASAFYMRAAGII